jgi:hypothetical protein
MDFDLQFQTSNATLKGFSLKNLFTHINLIRSSSFSIHEKTLRGLNPTAPIGMSMSFKKTCQRLTMLIKVIEPPTSVAPQPKVDLIELQLCFSPNKKKKIHCKFALLGGCSRYKHSWVDGLVGTSP